MPERCGDVGQLTPQALLDDYRFRSIGRCDRGLRRRRARRSRTRCRRRCTTRRFAAAGIDAVYLPLPAADADDFVTFARAIGLKGASVTIPFKVSLLDRVDEVDAVARRIGAINTIRVDGGRWIGGNTDVAGFLQPLDERGVPLGGHARVDSRRRRRRRGPWRWRWRRAAPRSRVHARNRSAGRRGRDAGVGRASAPWPPEPGSWDLLVNCTPIGMHPHVDDTPVPAEPLTGRLVYDLVYNPPATRLLRDAAAAGCQTIGGLDMLVAQAQEQFQWWTGDASAGRRHARRPRSKRLAEFSDR